MTEVTRRVGYAMRKMLSARVVQIEQTDACKEFRYDQFQKSELLKYHNPPIISICPKAKLLRSLARCYQQVRMSEMQTIHHMPKYRETLPPGCPVLANCSTKKILVMRLSKVAKPSASCFDSKAALGLDPGDIDPCSFASCSMISAEKVGEIGVRSYADALMLLPRFKKYFSHVFFLTTSSKMGNFNINENTRHVNVWFYDTFDPVEAVEKTAAI